MSAPSIRTNRLRPLLIAAVLVASLLPTTSALASHTPNPTSVTVAGSLQSEAGCPDDWLPECATTHLAYDADDDVWQGTFDDLPAGNYEYKAPLNDAWDENYGLHAVQNNGANIPLNLPDVTNVKFYYDHKSHWITDNSRLDDRRRPRQLPVRAGLLRRLGCGLPPVLAAGHRRRRHLHLRDDRAAGRPYEAKVAINESFNENYGAGGVLNGPNIAFSVPSDGTKVTFTYNATTHVLTIVVAVDHGAPAALARCRTSTWRVRTGWARLGTRIRRSGTRSPAGS